MFGNNKITKPSYDQSENTLNINSIFYSIQGEGPYAGTPAIFVRFQGCSLQCKFCDTEFETGHTYNIHTVFTKIKLEIEKYRQTTKDLLIVITGGEPLLQPAIVDLCIILGAQGFRVQIETAGTVWQPKLKEIFKHNHEWFTIVCSPKTPKLNSILEQHIDAYKYVIRLNEVDWIDGLPNRIPSTEKKALLARPIKTTVFGKIPEVFVMPCDYLDSILNKEVEKFTTQIALQYGYRFCLQLHKHLGLE